MVYPRTENLLKDIQRAQRSKVYLEVEDLTSSESQAEVIQFIRENPEMRRLSSTDINLSILGLVLSEDESVYKLMDYVIFQQTSIPTLCIRNKRANSCNGVSILVDLSQAKRRFHDHYHYYDSYYFLAGVTAVTIASIIGAHVSKELFDRYYGRK